jgi:hypothetical protein
MKLKNLPLILLILFAVACNNDKEKALTYLNNAQKLYDNADYDAAKFNLDSIKTLFPKEFEVQRQGLQLARLIEINEQQRNLILFDSMTIVRQAEFEDMKDGFLFEKDVEYDDYGKYVDKQQKLEKKLQRSYIRCSVNELGEFALASVYYGKQAIGHTQLKITNDGKEFSETRNVPYDGGLNYAFVDLGMTTEVVTYKADKENGIVLFIYNNQNSALKAEYMGGKKYAITVSQSDKNALVHTWNLALVLSDIERLKKEKEKSLKRLEYLKTKTEN